MEIMNGMKVDLVSNDSLQALNQDEPREEEKELTEKERIDKLEQDIKDTKEILNSMRGVYNPRREV